MYIHTYDLPRRFCLLLLCIVCWFVLIACMCLICVCSLSLVCLLNCLCLDLLKGSRAPCHRDGAQNVSANEYGATRAKRCRRTLGATAENVGFLFNCNVIIIATIIVAPAIVANVTVMITSVATGISGITPSLVPLRRHHHDDVHDGWCFGHRTLSLIPIVTTCHVNVIIGVINALHVKNARWLRMREQRIAASKEYGNHNVERNKLAEQHQRHKITITWM